MKIKINLLLKYLLYFIAVLFIYIWTCFLMSIFKSEMNFSWQIKLTCLIISILLNLSFILATFNFKKFLKWIVAILLIPTILFNFVFIEIIFDNIYLAIFIEIFIIPISYYQLFKKEVIL